MGRSQVMDGGTAELLRELTDLCSRRGLAPPRIRHCRARARASFFAEVLGIYDEMLSARMAGVELLFDYDSYFLQIFSPKTIRRDPQVLRLPVVEEALLASGLSGVRSGGIAAALLEREEVLQLVHGAVWRERFFTRLSRLSPNDMETIFGADFARISRLGVHGLHIDQTYFDPRVFDEKSAVAVGLVPFSYKGRRLLATATRSHDEALWRLDSYQALAVGDVDPESGYQRGEEGAREAARFVGQRAAHKALERSLLLYPHIEVDAMPLIAGGDSRKDR